VDSSFDQIVEGLRSPDYWRRADGCRALGEFGDARAVEQLIGCLGDGEWLVRSGACEALGKMGDARAVEPLIGRLGDGDGQVRLVACESLGRIGDARAVKPLIGRLGDEDWRVRRVACESLGKIGEARAVEPLIGRLGDGEQLVRQAACESLGKTGEARAVLPLIGRLGDGGWGVRWAACESLGKIGDVRAVEPLIGRLGDENYIVRKAACESLGKMGEARIAQAVVSSIDGRQEALPELRRLAAESDFRAQDPMVLSLAWSRAMARVVTLVFAKPLKSQWKTLLCSACLARMELKRGHDAEWYACRVCGKLGHALTGIENVVAVLDERWPEEQRREGGALRVNWLRRKALFDFDSVEIVRVNDLEAERFCIAVGNDMDEYRRARYKKMGCAIRDGAASESTLRNLRSLFGKVSRTA
jgi:HEAT repeat protein